MTYDRRAVYLPSIQQYSPAKRFGDIGTGKNVNISSAVAIADVFMECRVAAVEGTQPLL